MNQSPLSFSRRAFSLMELIVVIAIIAVIATYVVPQAAQILKGSTVTQASTTLTDQIRLAREFATTKNCKVEVRFYQYADPEVPGEVPGNPSTGQFRAIQVFQVLDISKVSSVTTGNVAGEVTVPIDKIQMLPQGVIMNSTSLNPMLSSILNNPPGSPNIIQGAAEPTGLLLPRGVGSNYNYITFRFLQDGSTNLAPTGATSWFITIHSMTDKGFLQSGGLPYNFFCIQIDPVVGTTKSFRPQAG